MQTLDIERPGMPDLQFTLLVTALCTSRLSSLNIPNAVRIILFDRCWVLLHESPPPRRPQERVLDLRPWTQVTLEALVDTIRGVLTEAGIRILTWEYPPSDTAQCSIPEVMPLIERFGQLYPQPFVPGATVTDDTDLAAEIHPESPESDIHQLIGDMTTAMMTFTTALERSAVDFAASGKQAELVDQLRKGAEIMRGSGAMYARWARHYVGLSEGWRESKDHEDDLDRDV